MLRVIEYNSHSRSLEMPPFDRLHTSSYRHSIVTIMALTCIVSEIKPHVWSKIAIFLTPPAFDASVSGAAIGMLPYVLDGQLRI